MARYQQMLESGVVSVRRQVSFFMGWNPAKQQEQVQGEMEDDDGLILIIIPDYESRLQPGPGSRWECQIRLQPINDRGDRPILTAMLIKKVSVDAHKPAPVKPAVQAEPQRLELQPAPKDVLPNRQDEQDASLEAEQLIAEAEEEKPTKPAQPRVGNGVVRKHKPKPKTKKQRREATVA